MKPAQKIWIVDDDPAMRQAFTLMMTAAGYSVAECADGQIALDRFANEPSALIVLDIEMPRLNGWLTLEELRRRGCTCPILVLTRVHDVPARVRGLETGADDFLGKPFSSAELLARIKALLRRTAPSMEIKSLLVGAVTIDFEKKTANRDGEPLRLTPTDFELLRLLGENRGHPVSREKILLRVWKGQAHNSHALDTHLWRLRKKIGDTGEEPTLIRNVPGIGYALAPAESEPAKARRGH